MSGYADGRGKICFPFVGDSIGGSHLSALLLIERLAGTGYEPNIVLHQSGPLAEYLVEKGLRFDVVPLSSYAGSSPSLTSIGRSLLGAVPPLVRYLRENRISLVHTNDLRMHLTWPLAARLAGCKRLWHVRVVQSGGLKWRLMSCLADKLICPSETIQRTLPRKMKNICEVIADPIESFSHISRSDARAKLLTELSLPQDAFLIGYVGNMIAQKRPLIFVDVAARIQDAVLSPVYFLMAGDDRGGEREAVSQRSAAHGIADCIAFVGYRSPIEEFLAGLDLLLAPAFDEGFGRVVAEGMTVGTPIVASDSGGQAEQITNGENGILVAQDDIIAFADAALKLMHSANLRQKFVDNAFSSVKSRYSHEIHVKRVVSVYQAMH